MVGAGVPCASELVVNVVVLGNLYSSMLPLPTDQCGCLPLKAGRRRAVLRWWSGEEEGGTIGGTSGWRVGRYSQFFMISTRRSKKAKNSWARAPAIRRRRRKFSEWSSCPWQWQMEARLERWWEAVLTRQLVGIVGESGNEILLHGWFRLLRAHKMKIEK